MLEISTEAINLVFEIIKNRVPTDQRQNCEPDNQPAAASPQDNQEDPRQSRASTQTEIRLSLRD